ncbi:dihydrofolate reductase [Paenibacillus sp. V4I3]|uniref:dihydrofolate reductase n=1 Tax=Paenibacillus sp. V4I3 TaxID=3042305 RepID=UPI003593CE47
MFIAGGGEIYKEALPSADKLYLTVVEQEIEGNIYFPEFEKDASTYLSEVLIGTIPQQ